LKGQGMAPPLHLVPQQPISADEAQTRLIALGAKPINATRLALEWNWSRSKVRRCVARCRAQGLIPQGLIPAAAGVAGCGKRKSTAPARAIRVDIREAADSPSAEGTQMEVKAESPAPEATREPSHLSSPADAFGFSPSLKAPRNPPPPPPARPSFGIRLVALLVGATGITLGAVGLILNVVYAQSYGSPGSVTASIMSVMFGLIDTLTILLPTTAAYLWREHQRQAAGAAWALCVGTVVMTLIATSSFSATNIGDAHRLRAIVTAQREALETDLRRLRADRARIIETRAPDAIEAAIQQQQPRVPSANWIASQGCTSVTLSGKQCEVVNALRQEKADAIHAATRRAVLDAQITAAETNYAKLPTYDGGDPGADMAAKLFTLATLGAVNVPTNAIKQIRIFGLTLAPATSGLLLLFAGLTWRNRRDPNDPPSLV
jgi:uncharacterized membrane protein YdcZ (DUF606 family)